MQALSIVKKTPLAAAPPPAPAGLSIVKKNGAAVEPDFRSGVVADAPSAVPEFVGNAWDYVVGSAEGLNPFPALDALGRAFIPDVVNSALGGQKDATGPWNFAKRALKAHEVTLDRAREAYAKGDTGTAVLHFTNWLVPMIGPAVDEAAYGEVPSSGVAAAAGARDSSARRAGRVTGVLGQLMLPKALSERAAGKTVGQLVRPNPELGAETLDFAEQNQVPLDAATATGSPFVRNVQKLADQSLSETLTGRAQTFREGQAAALGKAGERIAGDVRPADWTPERAGAHLRRQLEKKIGESRADASDAYGELREIEQRGDYYRIRETQPEVARTTSDGRQAVLQRRVTENVPLPVDVAPAKAGIKPLYDELLGKKERVGLPGDEARVLQALDKVMQSDDVQPLSQVDSTLSELKRLGRGDGPPTRARAAAAKAVQALEKKVAEMTAKAPPAVKAALDKGRAATRAKYEALDVLDSLKDEPVRTFRDLLTPGDASLRKLRAVAKFLPPEDMAVLGRAWVQAELEASSSGRQGWARARASWNRVGTETRKIVLGPKAATVSRDLDHFFKLAAEMDKSPNPSGTALTTASGAQLALLVTNPVAGAKMLLGTRALSALLYSPAGARLLTRGLTIPRANRLASAAFYADVAAMSERLGVSTSPAPATAQEKESPRR